MKNKSYKFIFVFILLISSTYIYITPYISILLFKLAIESNNSAKFNKYIDFNLLRASLKEQIYDIAYKTTYESLEEIDNYRIKMILIKPIIKNIVNASVDNTVTPKGIETLLKTGNMANFEVNKKELDNSESVIDNKQITKKKKQNLKLYYKGINSFVIENQINTSSNKVFAIWNRESIYRWKLVDIDFTSNDNK